MNIQYLIPIFGMAFVSWLAFLNHKEKEAQNKERSALIEKGIDPSLYDPKPKKQAESLKIGLMLIGTALGILFGYILNLKFGIPNFVAYSTMILVICGGILIGFHRSKSE